MLWQFAQMLWVGGLWLLHIGVLPVLGLIGLAPLLIDEFSGLLSALLVGFAAACVTLQALVLIKAEGLGSLWRDIRGQRLLMALYACAMFCVVRIFLPEALRWQLFSYLVLGFSGLRSEEHTSEPPSHVRNSYAGFCLKKKKNTPVNVHKINRSPNYRIPQVKPKTFVFIHMYESLNHTTTNNIVVRM